MRFARSRGPEDVERTLDTAWELFSAQPTHPKVAKLAAQVLAAQPERSSAMLLLGMHHEMSDRHDDARRLYLEVAGRRDNQYISAARCLRSLDLEERNHDEALRWARVVLEEDQEDWDDWMELGSALLGAGKLDEGWRQLDDAVALCARSDADRLPTALSKRAGYLLGSMAPPELFVPAAEEAMRAEAASPWVSLILGWAYAAQYRFDDAEQVALRLLRDDPTQELFHSLRSMVQTIQQTVENASEEGITLEDIKRSGVLETAFQHIREQAIGIDLASALAALDAVMPADLRASLGAPASPEAAEDAGAMAGETLVTWHDGQRPGSGATWGAGNRFRLMTAREIKALDDAIEADPAAYPEWPENDAWEQVMTDDDGSYLTVVAFGAVVERRAGQPDRPVAPSMADWIWDRVVAFGGSDPRPAVRTAPQAGAAGEADAPEAGEPGAPRDNDPAMIAELDRLARALGEDSADTEAQIALWRHVSRLDVWFFIARGTREQPTPYGLAFDGGPMICLYSSAERATEAAHQLGVVPESERAPLFGVPLPMAIDYVAQFEAAGVFGVTLDHPRIGHYVPMQNLALLKGWRAESAQ